MKGGALYDVAAVLWAPSGKGRPASAGGIAVAGGIVFRGLGRDEAGALMRLLGSDDGGVLPGAAGWRWAECGSLPAGTEPRDPSNPFADPLSMAPWEHMAGCAPPIPGHRVRMDPGECAGGIAWGDGETVRL